MRPKKHNAKVGVDAKIELRQKVLDAVGREHAIVFDAYAGPGAMYDAVWKDAAEYVGCDEVWYRDRRLLYVADNRRLLRCLDLQRFTVFDLDAFGSPWEQAVILAARRQLQPGERVGLLLTEGDGKSTRFVGSAPMRQLAGLKSNRELQLRSASRFWEASMRAKINMARQMGGEIVRHWRAEVPDNRAQMRYSALVVERAT